MRRFAHPFLLFGFVAVVVLAGLSAILAPASAAQGDLDLVSRASGAAGAKGNSNSTQSVISANGRFIAFRSVANNLHPDSPDNNDEVYVRDLQTNTTTLVSRASGANGVQGNSTSDQPAISADGRFVAFHSTANNLHPDDTDSTDDVFVRDLQENTTSLVSRATGAMGVKGDGLSREPSISADGSSVAFRSSAPNLHPDDTDQTNDVFVRDMTASTTTLVSRAAGATGAKGNANSEVPAISADGESVAFESSATNLHPDDADGTDDVFVRDLAANTTTLASRATGAMGAKGNGDSASAAISGDGQYIAFHSTATNLHSDDTDAPRDVFVRDLASNSTTLISRAAGATGAKGNGSSTAPGVSDDGRYISFQSGATNLHPDDTDTLVDIIVRDLTTNATTLVSRATGATGVKGNGNSFEAAISADGRFISFSSAATNLHPDDTDTQNDVFRRDVLGPAPATGPTPPPTTTTAQCNGLDATITGTAGDDALLGTSGADVIASLGGDDVIRGLGGDDIICGGDGNDKLKGGAGKDTLFGDAGRDKLRGGGSKDRCFGGADKDAIGCEKAKQN